MVVKKFKGKIYGAVLSNAEQKALDMEINRQIKEFDAKHKINSIALLLYALHKEYKFGKHRLENVYNAINLEYEKLHESYDEYNYYSYCIEELRKIGLDLDKLLEVGE